MARKKQPPISDEDREVVGRLLREVRRAAGYRSVETAAGVAGCPAARQTIYGYERGGFTPSLSQFLELVQFYVLDAPAADANNAEIAVATVLVHVRLATGGTDAAPLVRRVMSTYFMTCCPRRMSWALRVSPQ